MSSLFNFKMLNTRFDHSSKSTILGRLKKSISDAYLYPPFVQPAPDPLNFILNHLLIITCLVYLLLVTACLYYDTICC